MKNLRAVITNAGGPEVLSFIEEAAPQPSRGEVRLRVRAVGVAFADIYSRLGIYPGAPRPPFTPGVDVVGTVDAVGEGVVGIAAGERHAAIVERGGSARFLCVPAASLVRVPDGVRDEQAIAGLLNYVTAYQMLLRIGEARAGDTVFAHALAGGVGTAVLDVARAYDLVVVGTASAAKHDSVVALGGTPIDYRAENVVRRALELHPEGYRVVLDGIGGAGVFASHQLVRRGGTLVVFGFQSGAHRRGGALGTLARTAYLALAPSRRTRFYAIMRYARAHPALLTRDAAEMLSAIARGTLSPVIAAVLPLGEIAKAHALLERGGAVGKIVLRVD